MRYTAPSVPQIPPPDITPYYCKSHEVITRDLMYQYLNRYVYIWMYGNGSFWFYPTQVDERHLYGFVWTQDGWQYDQLVWSQIDAFY